MRRVGWRVTESRVAGRRGEGRTGRERRRQGEESRMGGESAGAGRGGWGASEGSREGEKVGWVGG